MNTFVLNAQTAKKQQKWHIVDADGQILGRLAVQIAVVLRGKDKPVFTPHADGGDYVVVINAAKIKTTAEKTSKKVYHRHSGYLGHLKTEKLSEVLLKNPEKVIYKAVAGMLPKNRLRAQILKKLKIFVGAEHKHESQNPQPLKVSK